MHLQLNRRSFLALIGATAAATACPAKAENKADRMTTSPFMDLQPRCFFEMNNVQPPARPKSSAITYL